MILSFHHINKASETIPSHFTSTMMGFSHLFIKSLFFTIFLISLVQSAANSSEQLVLISPVLAAHRNSKSSDVETAKNFPTLMLLTNPANVKEAQNRLLTEDRAVNLQPIYVKKLQDQAPPQHNRHRKRRTIHRKTN